MAKLTPSKAKQFGSKVIKAIMTPKADKKSSSK